MFDSTHYKVDKHNSPATLIWSTECVNLIEGPIIMHRDGRNQVNIADDLWQNSKFLY